MDTTFTIRLITSSDCKAARDIYKPFVNSTAITFDYDVPTIDQFSKKIETITLEYPWLVCLYGNRVIGYAYASKHRQKTAYQWSAESTVYISSDFHRNGIATILYKSLLSILKLQGYVNIYAGVALPNEKSEAFHNAFGFREIGIFEKIGFKLGQWHDVKWFQLHLLENYQHPAKPKTIKEIEKLCETNAIIKDANEKLKNRVTETKTQTCKE